ncbi:NRAMP family divalent metal transporter [Flavihumibacter profundi]|jgi:NRAMP (natural resistance-associated macrophage protein)-like metal ion transporter|uniref:NRAMP family divalent metal transporter n=1 Tax=Flavihumibacter profundi TaxID=2716883 RepID=UPI001CC69C5E|nr:divalent metal cation transporter [Flavihumibacter profundi]MBZ5857040.1 divalent metal cation transporter [Flavihumibacter profundi]
MKKAGKKRSKFHKFLKLLGPGLITGASDDDPSGIATYTQAGAKFGHSLLWTAILSYPLMVGIQEMCARIGLVTKMGLTGIIKRHYPKALLYMVILISFPSIILNIGADIAGMGAVANLLVPVIPPWTFSIFFTMLLLYSIIVWSYRKIATVLKWLCISLFAYLFIPFITKTDWLGALKSSFIPKFENDIDYFLALVGILGTTISPYLFFWQTSMEVEEITQKNVVVDKRMISAMESDVQGGMFLTNIVFYFIILAAANVLFSAGIYNINSVEEAAMALEPLAGKSAYALFALGVIGTGLLAIPVLAGSISYMISEAFDWEEGLDKKFHEAKGFYGTVTVSLILGLLIQFLEISPVKALLYTAVLYGMIAPILIGIILHICNNKNIMGIYTNSRKANWIGWITLIVMAGASLFLAYQALL